MVISFSVMRYKVAGVRDVDEELGIRYSSHPLSSIGGPLIRCDSSTYAAYLVNVTGKLGLDFIDAIDLAYLKNVMFY